jgi:hypothetical protein
MVAINGTLILNEGAPVYAEVMTVTSNPLQIELCGHLSRMPLVRALRYAPLRVTYLPFELGLEVFSETSSMRLAEIEDAHLLDFGGLPLMCFHSGFSCDVIPLYLTAPEDSPVLLECEIRGEETCLILMHESSGIRSKDFSLGYSDMIACLPPGPRLILSALPLPLLRQKPQHTDVVRPRHLRVLRLRRMRVL